jgi:hypothetical protein
MFEDPFQPIHLLVIAVVGFLAGFVTILPYWQIFKKAGFCPWLSLLMLIPLVNLCALCYSGFARWRTDSK